MRFFHLTLKDKKKNLLFVEVVHGPTCSPVCHCFPTAAAAILSCRDDYKNEHGVVGSRWLISCQAYFFFLNIQLHYILQVP